jgi:hypothetical protein
MIVSRRGEEELRELNRGESLGLLYLQHTVCSVASDEVMLLAGSQMAAADLEGSLDL